MGHGIYMILGTGIDIVSIPHMLKSLSRWGDVFTKRVFTDVEREYCQKKNRCAGHFAARFAVKEAFLKALGSGLVKRMKWSDVEVMNEASGKPIVNLSGEVKRVAKDLRVTHIFVSITHTHEYAIAQVILER